MWMEWTYAWERWNEFHVVPDGVVSGPGSSPVEQSEHDDAE